MLEAILCGMKSGATTSVNDNKVKGIIQEKEENPLTFYERLEGTFSKYTNLDSESIEEDAFLNYFVNQYASAIKQKLQKLHLGPLTSKTQLIDIAFQVYNNHDLEEEGKKQSKERKQTKLLAAMIEDAPKSQKTP
jgi:hypothetical protein